MKPAAVLILLAACTDFDYIDSHGIAVVGVDYPAPAKRDFEYAVDTILYTLPGPHRKFNRYLESWSVAFVDGSFPCSFGRCDGLSDFNPHEMTLAGYPCLGDGALAHEFVHLYQWSRYKDIDYEHKNAEFFVSGCLDKNYIEYDDFEACWEASLEFRLHEAAQEAVCGD